MCSPSKDKAVWVHIWIYIKTIVVISFTTAHRCCDRKNLVHFSAPRDEMFCLRIHIFHLLSTRSLRAPTLRRPFSGIISRVNYMEKNYEMGLFLLRADVCNEHRHSLINRFFLIKEQISVVRDQKRHELFRTHGIAMYGRHIPPKLWITWIFSIAHIHEAQAASMLELTVNPSESTFARIYRRISYINWFLSKVV